MASDEKGRHKLLRHKQTETLRAYEKCLADALIGVASEMRLIDVCDLIAYIKAENFANVGDLINSSAELYFQPGKLIFYSGANIKAGWDTSPSFRFDLEFCHAGVQVFFCLELYNASASVDIACISFDHPAGDPQADTLFLREAIEDARCATWGSGQPRDPATILGKPGSIGQGRQPRASFE